MKPNQLHTDFSLPAAELIDVVSKFKFHEPSEDALVNWIIKEIDDGNVEDHSNELKANLKKRRQKVKDGFIYSQKVYNGLKIGRLYAAGSSQTLDSEVRGTIFARNPKKRDIDIVNAHPTILLHLCRNVYGIDAPNLQRYVEERHVLLQQVQDKCSVPRDVAKELFSRLTNLGTIPKWKRDFGVDANPPGVVSDYRDELLHIASAIQDRYPAIARCLDDAPSKKHYTNPAARVVSFVLQQFECMALCSAVHEATQVLGCNVDCLIHDGMIAEIEDDELDTLARAVSRDVGGLEVRFAVKPFRQLEIEPPEDEELETLLEHTAENFTDVARMLFKLGTDRIESFRHDPVNNSYWKCVQRAGSWFWERCSHDSYLVMVRKIFEQHEDMFDAKIRKRFSESDRVATILKEHILHDDFEKLLDSSMSIYPVANGCYDYTVGRFRPIEKDDYVYKHASWSYEPGSNQTWFKQFMKRLMPVEEELDVVLTYISYTLCPLKDQKCLMALTDTSKGNCGKSSVVDVLRILLENEHDYSRNLYLEGRNLLLTDSSNSKNGHSGSVQALKGRFLLLADEMSSDMRLDDSFGKDTTGGTGSMLTGRAFGKSDSFSFPVKFSQLITFNEGQMPQVSEGGEYWARMLVAHFRTKFLSADKFEAQKNDYEYPCLEGNRAENRQMIRQTASGIFDALLPYYQRRKLLMSPPTSFTEFRKELAADQNPLMNWFEKTFEKTGRDEDFIRLADVPHMEDFPKAIKASVSKRKRMFKQCCELEGVNVKDRYRYKDNSTYSWKEARKVAIGLKRRENEIAEDDFYC